MAELETPEPTPAPPGGKPPAPASPGVPVDWDAQIHALYRKYYGRDAYPNELYDHRKTLQQGYGSLAAIEAELSRTRTTPPNPNPNPPSTTTPYSDAAFQAILRKYPATNDGIRKGVEEANKTFGTSISVIEHPTRLDKVRLPNGQIKDVIIGATGTSGEWGWLDDDGGGAGGPVDLASLSGSIDPSYLTPFNEKAPNPSKIAQFQAPGEFVAPDAQSLLKDPSYLWRLDQGRGALENSAAARGTLNSGGTLIDILNYGQKAASQEYSNVWDRAFGYWNANWNNALGKFQADSSSNNTEYDRLWKQYTERKDTHYRNQNEPWNKLIGAANLGASAAR